MKSLPTALRLALLVALSGCTVGQSVVGGRADASDVAPVDDVVDDLVDAPVDVPVDVPVDAPVDAPADAPADVPFRCTGNADCAAMTATPACDVATGQCVACVPGAGDTCPAGQYCTTANRCAPGCRNDDGCSPTADGGVADAATPAGPHCDVSTRACVACVTDDHCPPGNLCRGNVCAPGCSATRLCPTGQTCCDGACVDTQSNTAACGACTTRCVFEHGSAACMNGVCAIAMCTAPYGDCDSNAANGCETDTTTDVNHCGVCRFSCGSRPRATASCAAGACQFRCDEGFADCDGNTANGCETDTRTSATSCGACGVTCDLANATAACVASRCAVGACNAGFGDCDGNAANGCETDTRITVSNCGMCGRSCPSAPNAVPACTLGTCAITCTAGFADCDGNADNGCEVDTRSSTAHCGGCGRACSPANATGVCSASTCGFSSCNAGFFDCDMSGATGCETDTRTSVTNCGICRNTCAFAHAAATCAASTCALGACDAGFANCDGNAMNGCETDTRADVANCGACGTRCALAHATASCAASRCAVATCDALFGDCDGSAANGCELPLATDQANCGACGRACTGSTACRAGSCEAAVSCAEIHRLYPTLPSGTYTIDPDGAGAGASFPVYCEMTLHGGGWTQIGSVVNGVTRRWNTLEAFTNTTTFGAIATRTTDNFKSPAWSQLAGADLMIQTDEYSFGFNALLGGVAFGPYVGTNYPALPACRQTWTRSGADFVSSNLNENQRRMLGFTLGGSDINGGTPNCFPGTNENAAITFLAGPSWWTNGLGNCPSCAWSGFDQSLLRLSRMVPVACTMTSWPCNANGLWPDATLANGVYDMSTKSLYALVYVR